jgi:hypothetical protein
MEDIFDNLLYIVITIAALAISALGKKKKKQAQRASKVVQNNESETKDSSYGFNIEKLIRDELGLDNQEYVRDSEPEEIIDEETPVEEALDSVPKYMLDDKEDIPYSVEYDDSAIVSSSIQDNDLTNENTSDGSILDDFNLQDAIIYSEIINRKEY